MAGVIYDAILGKFRSDESAAGAGGDPNNLGWYATEAALNSAYPTADDGNFAIVGTTDTIWVWDSDTVAWVDTGNQATGDVVGPASAVDSNLAAFDMTTGKLVKDSGVPLANLVLDGEAQPVLIVGKVNEVAGVTKGQVVYISGATGGFAQVSLADNTDFTKSDTIAVAYESKTDGQNIICVMIGEVGGLDTSAFTEGDILYLGTAGNITNVHPSGTNSVERIGHAVKINASTGTILVEIDQLTSVANVDSTLRHQLVNLSTGNAASAAYTISNDAGQRVSLSVVGSNYTAVAGIASALVLYNEGYNKTVNAVDGNFGFEWWTDITDSHNLSATAKMTLTALGELQTISQVVNHAATAADDHAMELVQDAAGFGGVEALEIEFRTGAIVTGQDEAVILINIDESDAVGGEVAAIEVLATEGAATLNALFTGVGISPIEQFSGSFEDAATVLVLAVDQTVPLSGGGGGAVSTFVADTDTMTIGFASKFEELEFLFDTVASGAGIKPTFEFSTGVGLWTVFNPIDGTNGMRQNGVLAWLDADIPTWAIGTGSEFLIRITRTQGGLSTVPIADKVQVAAVTEYKWDKDGNLIVNSITLPSGPLVPGGTVQGTDGTYDIQATLEGVTAGNARGENSVDLCTERSDAAYVCTGVNSGAVAGENIGGTGTHSFFGAGLGNFANSGHYCLISGEGNHDNASSHSIIGGRDNDYINVLANYNIIGGQRNSKSGYGATGSHCLISGQNNHTNTGTHSCISGNASHTNSGNACNISGGSNRSNSGAYCLLTGGVNHTNSGTHCLISGQNNYVNSGNHCTISGELNINNTGDHCSFSGYFHSGNSGNKCSFSGSQHQSNSGSYCSFSGNYHTGNSGDYCSFSGRSATGNSLDYARIHGGSQNARIIDLVAKASTTNATVKALTLGGGVEAAGNAIVIPTDTTWGFTISVTARRSDADGESAFYKFEGCIDNNAGTVALVGTVTKSIFAEDTVAWDVNVAADNTLKAVRVTATGEVGKTIKWTARIDITQANG